MCDCVFFFFRLLLDKVFLPLKLSANTYYTRNKKGVSLPPARLAHLLHGLRVDACGGAHHRHAGDWHAGNGHARLHGHLLREAWLRLAVRRRLAVGLGLLIRGLRVRLRRVRCVRARLLLRGIARRRVGWRGGREACWILGGLGVGGLRVGRRRVAGRRLLRLLRVGVPALGGRVRRCRWKAIGLLGRVAAALGLLGRGRVAARGPTAPSRGGRRRTIVAGGLRGATGGRGVRGERT